MTAVVHSDSNDEEETNTMSAEQDGVPLEQTGQSDEDTMVTQVSLPTDDVAKKMPVAKSLSISFTFKDLTGPRTYYISNKATPEDLRKM